MYLPYLLPAMTFDESELAVTEEIKKVDSSRGTSINGESAADVRVGFSSGANSRAATRMTVRPETSMSHGTADGSSARMIRQEKGDVAKRLCRLRRNPAYPNNAGVELR